jgi:beta-glucosidase
VRDWPQAIAASHHLLLSHGWAVPLIRSNSPGAEVGIVLNASPVVPASPSAADIDAARHFDGYSHRWFLDPLYGRGYPIDVVVDYNTFGYLSGDSLAFVQPGDLAAIAIPTDFLGINYYSRAVQRSNRVPEHENLPRTVATPSASQLTDMGWEIYPDGLYELLGRINLNYHPSKIYVTENGASYADGPNGNGHVHDGRRITYLHEHFSAAHRAIAAGVPLAGYFVWSLLDNFEWAYGYTERFGIVWVDYQTRRRILKDSARWYRQVIAANAVVDPSEIRD